MQTVIDNLEEMSDQIKAHLAELIDKHSEIYRWNTPGDGLVVFTGNYAWRDLKSEGKQIQSKVLKDYRHFYAVLKTLLQDQPEDQLQDFDEYHKALIEIIEQNGHLYKPDKNLQLNEAVSALDSVDPGL